MTGVRLFQWVWVLQTGGGATLTTLSALSGAYSRKLSYSRSGTPEATGTIDVQHEDAYLLYDALRDGTPLLRCFRIEAIMSGTPLGVCRFAGPLLPLSATGGGSEDSDDGSSIDFTARGAFEFLEGRFIAIGEGDVFEYDAEPSGDIAASLVDEANAEQDTGIVIGNIDATVARDVSYSAKRISDAIDELASDFDYEVVPIADDSGGGGTLGELVIYSEQGSDKPDAKFGFGEGTVGNCIAYKHDMRRPINRAIVQGDEGLVWMEEDTDSQFKYGMWAEVDSMTDTVDAGLLQARAAEMLAPSPIVVVGFSPDPQLRDTQGDLLTPQVWRDYWLGDTVPLVVRDGAVQFDGSPRVDGVAITLDDDGFEATHDIIIADTAGSF